MIKAMLSTSLAKLKLPYLLGSVCLCGSTFGLANAKGVNIPDKSPLVIDADKGITCERDTNTCTATGNVRARKANFLMTSDELEARMRKTGDGKQEIWQITSRGQVRFFGAKGELALAPESSYNIDTNKIILEGRNQTAVAIKNDKLIKADRIIISLAKIAGHQRIIQIEAFGTVYLSSPLIIAHSNIGRYDPNTKIAVMTGGVTIDRAEGQIKGDHGEANLDNGTSKMLHSDSSSQVQTLLKTNVKLKTMQKD